MAVRRLFRVMLWCGIAMLCTMIVIQHSDGDNYTDNDGDNYKTIEEHYEGFDSEQKVLSTNVTDDKELQNEVNKMHKYVHSLQLTRRKVAELYSVNKSLERFLRRGARLKQKLLDVIYYEEHKKPEPKENRNKRIKTKTIIYNRINKSGSTSLLGRICCFIVLIYPPNFYCI